MEYNGQTPRHALRAGALPPDRMSPTAPWRPTARRPISADTDDAFEGVAHFSRPRQRTRSEDQYESEYEAPRRARRPHGERRDAEGQASYADSWPYEDAPRPAPSERRSRRRRQPTSWLRRNALSLAAITLLVALVAAGFGIIQLLNHGLTLGPLTSVAPAPAAPTIAAGAPAGVPTALPTAPAAPTAAPATAAPATVPPTAAPASPTAVAQPTNVTLTQVGGVSASVKPLEPNYTVQKGDSVYSLASKFGTSAERIQALNNLADPRMLNVGQQLIIPPAP